MAVCERCGETYEPESGWMHMCAEPADELERLRARILEMKPGPELDALVAEKVMGWYKVRLMTSGRRTDYEGFPPGVYGSTKVKKYSTDIAAAWEVVGMFSYIDIHRYDDFFACAIYPIGSSAVIRARGKTMPEAICKAALLAVME